MPFGRPATGLDTDLWSAVGDVGAHDRIGDDAHAVLVDHPVKNPFDRVPLLARRVQISTENPSITGLNESNFNARGGIGSRGRGRGHAEVSAAWTVPLNVSNVRSGCGVRAMLMRKIRRSGGPDAAVDAERPPLPSDVRTVTPVVGEPSIAGGMTARAGSSDEFAATRQ
jgi:hypothetical protein